MHTTEILKTERKIRVLLLFFITSLVISGLTAFPIQWELTVLNDIAKKYLDESSMLRNWIYTVHSGIDASYRQYPFLGYGTDWLAFSHLVIALFFLGPLQRPGEALWTIRAGIIACILILPLAIVAGEIREIPFGWRLIDCSFGIVGVAPLLWVLKLSERLQILKGENKLYMKKGALV